MKLPHDRVQVLLDRLDPSCCDDCREFVSSCYKYPSSEALACWCDRAEDHLDCQHPRNGGCGSLRRREVKWTVTEA